MDNKGFVPDFYNSAVDIWNIGKEMFEWYRDILGTEVVITRIKESDKRKKILSTTLTTTFEDSQDIEKLNWKLILNQSNMLSIWKRNADTLNVIDSVDKVKTGDLISFEYYGVRYQFKVQSTQAYGIGSDICWQYTLIPIIENKI